MKNRMAAAAVSLILTAFLITGFSGCGQKQESASGAAAQNAAAPETAVEESAEEAGQNPVMNFIGPYVSDRANAFVECEGDDGGIVTVQWGSSAFENTTWVMRGTFNTETLTIEYTGGTKTDYVMNEDGSVKSEKIHYENGTGRIIFSGEGISFTWEDDKEHIADGMVFEYGL